ncbi:hypothetical protein AAVH_16815 [Aphelenchoides avenae]|nr:hypothetical protein AAVH_16815 [Aphelenchus avenae]
MDTEDAMRYTDLKQISGPPGSQGTTGTRSWRLVQNPSGSWVVESRKGAFAKKEVGLCDVEMGENARLWYHLPESPPFVLAKVSFINLTNLEESQLPPTILSRWMTGSRSLDRYTVYRRSPLVKVTMVALPFTNSDQVERFLRYITGIKKEEKKRDYHTHRHVEKEDDADLLSDEELKTTLLYSTLLSTLIIGGFSLLAFLTLTGVTKRYAMRMYRWAKGLLVKRPVAAPRPRQAETEQLRDANAAERTLLLSVLTSTAGHAIRWLCSLSVTASSSILQRLVATATPEDDKAEIRKLSAEKLELIDQLTIASDNHKQEVAKSQRLERQLSEARHEGSAKEAEFRAEMRHLTAEIAYFKHEAEQARRMHERDKENFRSRIDELMQQLRDQRAVSESLHEHVEEMRRLVLDLTEEHEAQIAVTSQIVPPEAAVHAEQEPRSSQAAAGDNGPVGLPNRIEEAPQSVALENDLEFRAFADAVYVQLPGRAEGYTDINLFLNDFLEYAGIRGEEVARSFGFHSFENFLRSTYMAARVIIEEHPEAGTVYKQKPIASQRHLRQEQAIGMEYVIQRRINDAVRHALERQRGEVVNLQQALRAEKAKLQRFTSGVMQSKFAQAAHFRPSSVSMLAPSVPPDGSGEPDQPSTSRDEGSRSEPECSICLDNHGLNATIYKCGHRYHFACIMREMEIRKMCPQCRQPITDVIQSY